MRSLPFGDTALPCPPSLAGAFEVVRPEPAPADAPAAALHAALDRPIAGQALDAFLAGAKRALLVLPDATRPAPRALVDALLSRVHDRIAGVRIANGTHRRATPEERARLLGDRFRHLTCGDRDADDPAAHRPVQGARASLDAALDGADAVVLMGPVSFHYLAGFGGGGKLVAPGLADRGTAEWIHAACLAPGGGRHLFARAGQVDGNPLRERIEAVCRAAPPQFHVVPVLDSSGRAVEVFAGEREPAWRAACEALGAGWSVPLPRRFPWVVASAGGSPYDLDFVQAHKALEAAAAACSPGGTIVFAARCGEGLPARHRAFLARHRDAAGMEASLREVFDIAAHTVWAARLKAERFRIRAVTAMADDLVRALGMERCRSLEEAIAGVPAGDIALLPRGARFLPRPPEEPVAGLR